MLVLAACSETAQAGRVQDATSDEHRSRLESSKLTPVERAQSQQWGLNKSEWQRYKILMQGIRGRLSPDISPIEALGIHARSEEERQGYAEQWATAMREDTERILAFQRAYNAAWQRLYGNEPLIDPSRLPHAPASSAVRSGDRLLFFTGPKCPSCDSALKTVLSKVRQMPKLGLDIYIVSNDKDDAKVRAWAKGHDITPDLVRTRTVTLNHDNGALVRLSGFTGTVPYLVRRRGEQFVRIEPYMLELR